MFFTTLQPTFSKVAQKPVTARETKPVEVKKAAVKPVARKPKLFGRVSEVTIAAMGLMLLAPIGAIAYAAGLPSFFIAAGAVAGLFGAAVVAVEQKVIRS